MKLRDLIEVSYGAVNIRLYDKEYKGVYGQLRYEESFLANIETSNVENQNEKFARQQKSVLHKYSDWEVTDVWGFDNGLTAVIKDNE